MKLRRLRLKCDGTRAETTFRLTAKWTRPFKSAGASVQSTNGSRVVRISGSNAGYTMFRGSVKGTGYPHHSPVSPSLPLPCVTVCHHVSTGVCQWQQTVFVPVTIRLTEPKPAPCGINSYLTTQTSFASFPYFPFIALHHHLCLPVRKSVLWRRDEPSS